MPGSGRDVRAVQQSAAMKDYGKRHRPGKIEKHIMTLSRRSRIYAMKQNFLINEMRNTLRRYLFRYYSEMELRTKKLIQKIIRSMERYLLKHRTIISTNQSETCGCGSIGMTSSVEGGRAPPVTIEKGRISNDKLSYFFSSNIRIDALLQNDEMSRRGFLNEALKGLAAIVAGSAVLNYLSKALAQPDENTQPDANISYPMPPDSVLEQYMHQPVEKTLEGTGVVYVNDYNYEQEVLNADRPVMVLFYANDAGSKGLAALVKVLNERFPQIKVCAYKETDRDYITPQEFEALKEKYPLKDSPSILFYDNDNGKMELQAELPRGPPDIKELKRLIRACYDYIPKKILD